MSGTVWPSIGICIETSRSGADKALRSEVRATQRSQQVEQTDQTEQTVQTQQSPALASKAGANPDLVS